MMAWVSGLRSGHQEGRKWKVGLDVLRKVEASVCSYPTNSDTVECGSQKVCITLGGLRCAAMPEEESSLQGKSMASKSHCMGARFTTGFIAT